MPLYLYELFIPEPDKLYLKKLIPCLSLDLQNKISSYRLSKDQWRVILTHFLVRKTIAKELCCTLDSLIIEADRYGKPYLKGKKRQFNISHSEDLIVLATDDTPVGIDIEYIHFLNDLDTLFSNFSEEEQRQYLMQNKEKQLEYFYELWTLKESYIKAIGKGLSCPLKSFTIDISENEVFLSHPNHSAQSWFFKRYTLRGNYKGAICAQHHQFPEEVIVISVDDVLDLDYHYD